MTSYKNGILIVIALALSAGSATAVQSAKRTVRLLPASAAKNETVLVIVNHEKITEADLARSLAFNAVPEEERARVRQRFLNNLIDTRLIQQFLKSRKTAATKKEIDEQISLLKNQLKPGKIDPEKALAERGFTTELLREQFAVPLAWNHHIQRIATPEYVKKYFAEHRAEFDGTKVRTSQIRIKVVGRDEEAWKAAEARMNSIRQKILDKKISFEDAAREYSEAPSKEQGGDLGWFPYASKMPAVIAREAFRLKVGEMSQPFRTTFGVHLCLVTDRKPGDLSLEDVRDDLLARMREELWNEKAAELRQAATIEWSTEKP